MNCSHCEDGKRAPADMRVAVMPVTMGAPVTILSCPRCTFIFPTIDATATPHSSRDRE
jgi:hypothetical protein